MSDLGNKKIMANNIKYYLKKKSISRKKLAADLGISYTTIASWLQADSYPRIDKIEMMANYFGVDKSDLVEKRTAQKDITDSDLEDMLDNAHSYDGKPMDDHDRALIKQYLEALFSQRESQK